MGGKSIQDEGGVGGDMVESLSEGLRGEADASHAGVHDEVDLRGVSEGGGGLCAAFDFFDGGQGGNETVRQGLGELAGQAGAQKQNRAAGVECQGFCEGGDAKHLDGVFEGRCDNGGSMPVGVSFYYGKEAGGGLEGSEGACILADCVGVNLCPAT